MKKYILLIILLILSVLIIFVFVSKKDAAKLTTNQQASLQFSWIPSGSFAGDVVGIKKFDEKNNIDISSSFGGPGINPIQMVISGQKTFGWAGSDEVLAANDKGADLVIIGLIHYYPPVGFASFKEKNIKTPKDLEGKKVGILPFGNSTMVYETMLKQNDVDRKKISEITISNDLKPFLNGSYDVHPIYVYDEIVDLEKQNREFNIIKPEDFGVRSIKGYVYFTKKSTLDNNPELVKSFIDTMADGWNFAIKNPKAAIDILKEFAPEIDIDREIKVLQNGIPYFTNYNKQPINSDIDSWNTMIETLKQTGIIKDTPDLSKVLQFQFINEYYK
ncbi:MAG: ABC transporter substrate-binding protein [Candidatus Paceibacterota bacterium]